jgi:hypothetical protein
LFYLEYDAPWHATALRLAGVYAAALIPSAIAIATRFFLFDAFTFVLLCILYAKMLELEMSEAVVMCIVTRVTWYAIAVGLYFAFA